MNQAKFGVQKLRKPDKLAHGMELHVYVGIRNLVPALVLGLVRNVIVQLPQLKNHQKSGVQKIQVAHGMVHNVYVQEQQQSLLTKLILRLNLEKSGVPKTQGVNGLERLAFVKLF